MMQMFKMVNSMMIMQWTHLTQTIHLQMICGMVIVRPGTRDTAKIPAAYIRKAIQDHARTWKSGGTLYITRDVARVNAS